MRLCPSIESTNMYRVGRRKSLIYNEPHYETTKQLRPVATPLAVL